MFPQSMQRSPILQRQTGIHVHLCSLSLSGQSYPKPSISVSPGGIVALGENATIHCRSLYRGATFVLYNQTHFLQVVQASNKEAVFPIANIKQSDQGSYWCRYCFPQDICSLFSSGIKIQLAGESLAQSLCVVFIHDIKKAHAFSPLSSQILKKLLCL